MIEGPDHGRTGRSKLWQARWFQAPSRGGLDPCQNSLSSHACSLFAPRIVAHFVDGSRVRIVHRRQSIRRGWRTRSQGRLSQIERKSQRPPDRRQDGSATAALLARLKLSKGLIFESEHPLDESLVRGCHLPAVDYPRDASILNE